MNKELSDLARDLGYKENTIKCAETLTYNTILSHTKAYERTLFASALLIAENITGDKQLTKKKMAGYFGVNYKNMVRHQKWIVKSSDMPVILKIFTKKAEK